MFTKLSRTFLAAAAAVALLGGLQSATAHAAEKELVEYRLKNWKTVEFEDSDLAKTHVETIQKLGCEVKQEDHNGHMDVSYRCLEWKQIALKTHADAHNWEKWLKASGFETRHSH